VAKKHEIERNLDSFVEAKRVKLMAQGHKDMLDPLVQVFDLLALQELDLKMREVNPRLP
jgi:CelD/BcsL family acetyltransferase involved in cellulose biosynthesis